MGIIDDILVSIAAIFMTLVMLAPLLVMIDERREIRRANRMKESETYKDSTRLNAISRQMEEEKKQIAKEKEAIALEWSKIEKARKELDQTQKDIKLLSHDKALDSNQETNNMLATAWLLQQKAQEEYEKANRERIAAESEKRNYSERVYDLQIAQDELIHERDSYLVKKFEADEQISKYNEAYSNLKRDVLRDLSEPLRLDPIREEQFINEFFGAKGERAVTQKMDFSILKVECEVFSRKSGYTYTTSLTSCSCRDYEKNKKDNAQYVCKHMLALAIHLNAFKVDPFIMTEKQAICAEREKEFIRNAKIAEEEYSSIAKELELLREEKSRYDKWQNDVRVDFPWIAETLAWMEERYDNIRIEALPKNASKARETTQALSKEKVALATRVGELEARLAAYDYFRLDRFKNISLDELRAIVGEKENPRDSGEPDLEGKQ